jgi:hypothetical protein
MLFLRHPIYVKRLYEYQKKGVRSRIDYNEDILIHYNNMLSRVDCMRFSIITSFFFSYGKRYYRI